MSTKRKPNSQSPLRAALAKKTTLRTYFDLSIVSSEEVEAAQQRVDMAQQIAAATLLSKDADVRVLAQEELDTAKAARAACFHRLWFKHLDESEFDALVQLHPPTKAQAADKWLWNPDTFNYALLEHAAAERDLTAEEWAAEFADTNRWSRADKARVIAAALAAQQQTMADAVPKG